MLRGPKSWGDPSAEGNIELGGQKNKMSSWYRTADQNTKYVDGSVCHDLCAVGGPAGPKICVVGQRLILSTRPTETPFTGCCVKWFIEIVVIIKERVQAMTSKIRLQGVCFNFPPSKSAVPNWVPPRGPFCGFGFPLGLLFVPRSPFSPF